MMFPPPLSERLERVLSLLYDDARHDPFVVIAEVLVAASVAASDWQPDEDPHYTEELRLEMVAEYATNLETFANNNQSYKDLQWDDLFVFLMDYIPTTPIDLFRFVTVAERHIEQRIAV